MDISVKIPGLKQLYVASSERNQQAYQKSEMKDGALYAGEKIVAFKDFIGEKKAQVNREAMKQIFETFAVDTDMDQKMSRMSDEQKTSLATMKSAKEQLRDLEKKVDQFTPEEYEEIKTYFQSQADEAFATYEADGKGVSSMRLERLKSHGMVDAQKTEDKMRETAAKELAGIYYDDGIQQLNKKFKGIEEEIKKAETEKADQEKADQKKVEEKTSQTKLETEKQTETKSDIPESFKEVRKFIRTERILKEDYLGLLMDKVV